MKTRFHFVLYNVIWCLLLCSCKANVQIIPTSTEPEAYLTTAESADNTVITLTVDVTAESISDTNSLPEVTETPFFELDNTLSSCQLIDKSLDCEKILLDRADKLSVMMRDYLNVDTSKLAFELGDSIPSSGQIMAYKVISDDIKTYDDFKLLFSSSIYGGYVDKICSWNPRLEEVDGELCFFESAGGYIGSLETWYLGCDIVDDRIIGHFALLHGVEDMGLDDAEYLNDENNYSFYDIIVQNVDGEYVLTDCNGTDDYLYYRIHGWLYNLGAADRSLITNEKVKPYADT